MEPSLSSEPPPSLSYVPESCLPAPIPPANSGFVVADGMAKPGEESSEVALSTLPPSSSHSPSSVGESATRSSNLQLGNQQQGWQGESFNRSHGEVGKEISTEVTISAQTGGGDGNGAKELSDEVTTSLQLEGDGKGSISQGSVDEGSGSGSPTQEPSSVGDSAIIRCNKRFLNDPQESVAQKTWRIAQMLGVVGSEPDEVYVSRIQQMDDRDRAAYRSKNH